MDLSHSLHQPSVKKKKNHKEAMYTTLFLGITVSFIYMFTTTMGLTHFFQTIMATAYSLLIDTALYIIAISIVMGAFGNLLSEFGVVKLLNYLFAPLMKPLYKLPGASFLGITTTYLSDNPAIITLAKDDKYLEYFDEEQIPLLCNLGTAFGMGLILTTFMMGLGFFKEALIGNLGAIIGSIVSVRLMAYKIKKMTYFKKRTLLREQNFNTIGSNPFIDDSLLSERIPFENKNNDEDTFFIRFMSSMLTGGKKGIEMSIAIIPGLVFVCTLIMLFTFGPKDTLLGYQGLAYEGIGLLPKIGEFFTPILQPLFGFTSPEAIAFPITSLGAVGAALSLVPKFLDLGLITGNDIAVFTAMGMCWSGFLSTHVGMMDAIGHRKLISPALFSHTIGGLVAGISAHFIYLIFNLL